MTEEAQRLAGAGAFPTVPIEWRFKGARHDGRIVAGTAKIRDMRIVGNDGKQVLAHFVVLTAIKG